MARGPIALGVDAPAPQPAKGICASKKPIPLIINHSQKPVYIQLRIQQPPSSPAAAIF